MRNHVRRPKRLLAGFLAAVLAITVMPFLGFNGVASAQEVADPTGEGNFCEDVPQTEPFTDVQDTDPSYEEIVCLVATEITTGVTATTYEPNSFVTRRQMALFLVRLANEADRLETDDSINELPAPADTDFSDTEDEEQFIEDAISQISQAGVAQGFPDGTYRPAAPVSRRQMAAFIDRLYEYLTGEELPATEDHFEDDDADSAEAQESTNAVAEAGIFIGNEDGTFRPAQEITRRQMANVITRTLQVLMENGFITQWVAAPEPGESFTEAPELVTATFVSTDGTTGDHLVRYTFDEAIAALAAGAEGLFHLHTVDGENVYGVEAVIDPGDSSSVLVRFAGTDIQTLEHVTTAAVDAEAVHDAVDGGTPAGMTNPEDDIPFQAVTFAEGESMAPDVIRVENLRVENTAADQWHIRLDFVFDQPAFQSDYWFGSELCPGSAGNVNLSLVDGAVTSWSTERISADACVDPDPDGDTVWSFIFASGQASQADAEAIMADVRAAHFPPGVAEDASGNYQNNRVTHDLNGGDTFGPEVVNVTLIPGTGTDPDVIRVQFDEPVTPQSDDVVPFARNGAESWIDADATGAHPGTDLTVVDWEYPQGTLTDLDWLSHVQIAGNAVMGNTTGFVNHPETWFLAGTTYSAGETLAPVLTGVTVAEAEAENTITFTFDKDISNAGAIGDFAVYDADGARTVLTACVATAEEDNEVVCTAARGGGILPAAEYTAIADAVLGGVASETVDSLLTPGATDPSNHADSEAVA